MAKIHIKGSGQGAPQFKNNGHSTTTKGKQDIEGRTGYVPPAGQPEEQRKGILSKMWDIIVVDFKGRDMTAKKGSEENWKDWEGQLK